MRTSKSLNTSWYRWEDKVAKDLNGKTTPGSGNQDFQKGDVINKNWLIDCKDTDKNSYSIKKSLWDKYEKIAQLEGKEFGVALNINGRKVFVLDYDTFLELQDFYFGNN